MLSVESAPSTYFILLSALALVPFVAVLTTAFIKLSVVLLLLRNALGVQGIPPNIAVYGLAIILTIYVMVPVARDVGEIVVEQEITLENLEDIPKTATILMEPFKAFLIKHTDAQEKEFFVKTAKLLWPKEDHEIVDPDGFMVLIPAFAVTELTSAFEIGFLIYLPFVVIDLVISNILLALGMMMVSPMTISLPFKLLLFVLVDGWARLIHALVLTYQ